ncbi:MAG: hypothetical protein OXD50_07495 [Chloroflexi bacterium]|nr:hypothetical protein [Chloroflexota bacterium]
MKRIISVTALAGAIVVAALTLGWNIPSFSAGAQEVSADANVRISAQRLDTGRVQFGLRALDGSGQYTAPVEPRVNAFNPASVRAGRWLRSSTLILEVDESGRGRLVPSEQFEATPRTETTLVSGIEDWAGDIRYSAFHDADEDLVTSVSVYSAATGAPDGELRTTITCQDGETSVTLGGLASDISSTATARQINVRWSVDGGASSSERRAAWPVESGTDLIALADSRLAQSLLGAGSALTLSIDTTPALTTTIDLAALSALPVYDNLVHCGGDASTSDQSGHTELRIRAQLRDDDRIEFAVQQRTEDGWSENILPRVRYMPAFGEATNWLSSTPVTVPVQVAPSQRITLPAQAERTVQDAINPILRSGYRTASLSYSAEIDQSAKLNSVITAQSDQGLALQVGCFADVSRIQLLGASAASTGAITLAFDGAQSAANWNVIPNDDSASLRPTDTVRMIERVRRADSLVVTAGSSTATFALAGMFETPIQPNLDQCGNYIDPSWRPITEAQLGVTDAGATYSVRYPEWLGGQRRSEVRLDQTGEATGDDGRSIELTIDCREGRLGFQILHLPSAMGDYTVRSRVDDGEWLDEAWTLQTTDSDWSFANFQTDLDRLRGGATLEYEFPLRPIVRASFDLTALFGTPVQPNIDNCGRALWPPNATYVPIANVQGNASAAVSYSAMKFADGSVYSSVTNTVTSTDAPEGFVNLEISCYEASGLRFSIGNLSDIDSDELDVILSIDDRPAETSSWAVGLFPDSDLRYLNVWRSDATRLLAGLRAASTMTVTIPASGLAPLVFDLSGMFDTPVQENLDECGYYKPGETREPPPTLSTSGETQGLNDRSSQVGWSRSRGPGSTPSSLLYVSHVTQDNVVDITLYAWCSGAGLRLYLIGSLLDSLSGEETIAQWSLDGGTTQHETWNLTELGSFRYLSPIDATPVVAAWREASLLDLEVVGAPSIVVGLDLGTMFDAPVIDAFDKCVAMPLPDWTPPVTDVQLTQQGDVSYEANTILGSTWEHTRILLTVPNETGGESAGYSSLIEVACRTDGLGVAIYGIGRATPAFIADDTVQVTWRVGDGPPQTGTWNVWPFGSSWYAVSPTDDAAFYTAIKGADSLSVNVESEPVFTQTYDFAGNDFWSTPVQPNLDACGGS